MASSSLQDSWRLGSCWRSGKAPLLAALLSVRQVILVHGVSVLELMCVYRYIGLWQLGDAQGTNG